MRRTRQLAAGTAVATLAVSGVAACGNGSGSDSAENGRSNGGAGQQDTTAVKAAFDKTASARSAHLSITEDIAAGGRTIRATGGGVVAFGSGDSDVTVNAGRQTIEERTLNGVLYAKIPSGERDVVPGKKQWIRLDLTKAARHGGSTGSLVPGTPQLQDPNQSLRYLKGLSGKQIDKVGTENVHGVRTTHYKVRVDVGRLAGGSKARAAQLRKQFGSGTVPLDIWLDQDGRLRQMRMDTPIKDPDQSSGHAGKLNMTLGLSHFGTHVKVTAPPSAQVADVTGRLAKKQ